jgi:hypothetical protein
LKKVQKKDKKYTFLFRHLPNIALTQSEKEREQENERERSERNLQHFLGKVRELEEFHGIHREVEGVGQLLFL